MPRTAPSTNAVISMAWRQKETERSTHEKTKRSSASKTRVHPELDLWFTGGPQCECRTRSSFWMIRGLSEAEERFAMIGLSQRAPRRAARLASVAETTWPAPPSLGSARGGAIGNQTSAVE